MLGEFGSIGGRAEDGEDERDSAADGAAAVEGGGGAEEEVVFARTGFPGGDCGTVEEDGGGFTCVRRKGWMLVA